jgi:chromosome segregation ATPase
LSKFEGRISQLDQEILRLNEVLKRKIEELDTWESRYKQIYAEREELMKVSHELQRRLQDAG